MKLKVYLQELREMVDADPSILDLEVIYSEDDRGSDYNRVAYTPCLGYYNDQDQEFIHDKVYIQELREDDPSIQINAICLN